MKAIMSLEHIQSKLGELDVKNYSKYQWWRRFKYRTELDEKAPLYNKIVNGDYDVSDYIYQVELEDYLMQEKLLECKNAEQQHDVRRLFKERQRRLSEDFEKDEADIMRRLKKDFTKTFKITIQQLDSLMENFEGSLLDLYNHVKLKYQ
jgi:hypothetical protein